MISHLDIQVLVEKIDMKMQVKSYSVLSRSPLAFHMEHEVMIR